MEEKFVKVSGPAQVYSSMDSINSVLRRAQSIVGEIEDIRVKKESIKEVAEEEIDKILKDLEAMDRFLGNKEERPREVPKAPRVVKREISEVKPIVTSVKIKPKKDAEVEKQKIAIRSSIHDLKGELEKLKKELGKK